VLFHESRTAAGTNFDPIAYPVSSLRRRHRIQPMNIHLSIGPLMSLIAGILILIMPRLLNYIIAIYLILIGLVGLLGRAL
jgi:hypothetical protein